MKESDFGSLQSHIRRSPCKDLLQSRRHCTNLSGDVVVHNQIRNFAQQINQGVERFVTREGPLDQQMKGQSICFPLAQRRI